MMLALGRLMTRELVLVVMLKLVPAVPVETLAIKLVGITFKDLMLLEASVITTWEAEVEAMTTLPEGVTWKKEAPEVEATAKTGRVWAEVEATTKREAPAGVEELMIKLLAVLSQRKLEEDWVLEAAVA